MSEGGIFPCTRKNCRQCNPKDPNYTKSGLPHGGRIAYPKPYYQIMVSKNIAQNMKKIALAEIRRLHSLYPNGSQLVGYTPYNAKVIVELLVWSMSPLGYWFWHIISKQLDASK